MRPGKGQIDRGRFARRETMATVTFEDFQRIEMRVGRIVAAEDFPEARNPSYKLRVDFGSHGVRRSSAAVQPWYHRDDLLGRPVVAVTNFPSAQDGPITPDVHCPGAIPAVRSITARHPGP